MKITARALILWSCIAAAPKSSKATTNTAVKDDNGAGQLLKVFIALQTRLDHDEVERIHSSFASSPKDHEWEQLKADKEAVLLQAKAHVEPCLQSFQSFIKEHNNNNGDDKKGGHVELIPFSKDGSQFYLTGSAKNFAMFLEKRNDGDNDGKAEFDISTATYKFPDILAQCIGVVGTFHRRNLSDDKEDDTTNINKKRKLASDESAALLGSCFTPNSSFDKFMNKFPLWKQGKTNYPQSSASTIRDIYGVPEVSGKCYNPRDSAVFEYDSGISIDDLACYTQYNNLPDTTITPVDIDGSNKIAVVQYPQGFCPPAYSTNAKGVKCNEGNLDVQMLSAMSGGTNIHAFTFFDGVINDLEEMMKALGHLAGQKFIPAVMSMSVGTPEHSQGNGSEIIQVCNEIGHFSIKYGTTFFASSGDQGASNTDGCGTYNPLFPATCRYVTAVGGSSGIVGGKEELSIASTLQGQNIVSGGGFSKVFPYPKYQASHIAAWLNTTESKNSAPGYKVDGGAGIGIGYPDVSALSANLIQIVGNIPNSVGGTSASAPIFAGMVNLCASQLPLNVSGFGWINPTLYKANDLFFDIKGQNNQYVQAQIYGKPVLQKSCYEGCGAVNTTQWCDAPYNSSEPFYGFAATKGWDPASGLGTLGTTNPNDPTKGFRGLCNALLPLFNVKHWDPKKLKCDKKVKKVKKSKNDKHTKDTKNHK